MNKNKAMMKIDELNLTDYTEENVFNLLHDIHQEISLKQAADRNKSMYIKAYMSRPITSPSETMMDRKNVVLVGAGSGISPFLPLLEEIVRLDKGKSNAYNFDKAYLIIIAREGEQISWISNFIFHILSSSFLQSILKIEIYITMDKELETLPSFLFWRALLLIGMLQKIIKIHDLITRKIKTSHLFINHHL
jgi:hypothetical protein